MELLRNFWWLIPIFLVVAGGLFTINQGTIGVVTRLGKYHSIKLPGLNFKVPFLDQIYKRVSIQNRSVELEFQAVTIDQANVYFKSMILFSVMNVDEEFEPTRTDFSGSQGSYQGTGRNVSESVW